MEFINKIFFLNIINVEIKSIDNKNLFNDFKIYQLNI